MSADILRDLARAKAAFQLRAIEAIIHGPAIVDGTATAAANGDLPVPQDCQARACKASPDASPSASPDPRRIA